MVPCSASKCSFAGSEQPNDREFWWCDSTCTWLNQPSAILSSHHSYRPLPARLQRNTTNCSQLNASPLHTLHTKLPSNRVAGHGRIQDLLVTSWATPVPVFAHKFRWGSCSWCPATFFQWRQREKWKQHGNKMKQHANKWSFIIFILRYSVARQGITCGIIWKTIN